MKKNRIVIVSILLFCVVLGLVMWKINLDTKEGRNLKEDTAIVNIKPDATYIEEIILNYNSMLTKLTKDKEIPLEYIKSTTGTEEFYKETTDKISEYRMKNEVLTIENVVINSIANSPNEENYYLVNVTQEINKVKTNVEYKVHLASEKSGIVAMKKVNN